MLFSHPRLGLPRGLLPAGFPTTTLYAFLVCLIVSHVRLYNSLLDHLVCVQYKSPSFSPCTCLQSPVRPKYLPQHPILERHQPVVLIFPLFQSLYRACLVILCYDQQIHNSWFQTFAVFWMLYYFSWVIPRRLSFKCRRFGTLSHLHYSPWRWNSVPKRRHLNHRRRGITQKK
jgi:hypothetical protein